MKSLKEIFMYDVRELNIKENLIGATPLIIIILMVILLVGCNTNVGDELKAFCLSKGYEDYNSIMNYNYEDTMVHCITTSYLGFKTDKEARFNISCIPVTSCLKFNEWGECTKNNYNYTCV